MKNPQLAKRSPWSIVFAAMLSSPSCIFLIILSNILNAVNIKLSVMLHTCSSNFIKELAAQSANQSKLMSALKQTILLIIFHYTISSLISFFKSMLGSLIFFAALRNAVGATTTMRNRDFHKRGHGKCQDDIQKSSWAVHEVSYRTFVDVPKGIATFVYYSYTFSNSMSSLTFLIFISAMLGGAFSAFLIAWFVRKYERRFILLYRSSLVVLSDILKNFDIIQAFNRERTETQRYAHSLVPYKMGVLRFIGVRDALTLIQKISLMLPHFVILYLLITGVDIGMPISSAVTYNALFMDYRRNFVSTRDDCFMIAKCLSEMDSMVELVPQPEGGPLSLPRLKNEIRARDMSLRVGDRVISTNLSFNIKTGEKIAITGLNGCGKSTFLKTLLRFQENLGTLEIDGVPIEEVSVASLRRLFSYVPQNHHIMNSTVLFNLCYAQEKPDEEEVYKLCKQYGCHEFFMSMSDGYNTQAGEDGEYLSGGQKQRINFMRAIIRGSPVILMDEPTSNLDKRTEEDFVRNILVNARDRTVIVIIHNIDLLSHFDRILYFRQDQAETFRSYSEFLEVHNKIK